MLKKQDNNKKEGTNENFNNKQATSTKSPSDVTVDLEIIFKFSVMH